MVGVCVSACVRPLKACWFWSFLSLSDDPPSSSPPEETEEEDEDSTSSQQGNKKRLILDKKFFNSQFLWLACGSSIFALLVRLLSLDNSEQRCIFLRRKKNGMPLFPRFKWFFPLCKNLILCLNGSREKKRPKSIHWVTGTLLGEYWRQKRNARPGPHCVTHSASFSFWEQTFLSFSPKDFVFFFSTP